MDHVITEEILLFTNKTTTTMVSNSNNNKLIMQLTLQSSRRSGVECVLCMRTEAEVYSGGQEVTHTE